MNEKIMSKEIIEKEPECFDVITEEEIDECKRSLNEEFGIDLSGVSINIAHPGDKLYDHYEIQQALFLKCSSDFNKMIDLIKGYNYDPDNITIDQFKDVADKEGIALEGKLPGFAMSAGDDEIIFFGIKEESIKEMAEKYALKEGDQKTMFSDIEEAKNYLKSMGKKYFMHETGHIVYKRLVQSLQKEWDNFVEKCPDLKKKIIELQKDKYNDDERIPISEEAFADYFVDITSNDKIVSRLGENKEAVDKLKEMLFKA